jgi:hypothetical protein
LTIPINQTTDFVAVGTTASGDTTEVAVSWSATGGSIVDSSSGNGRHFGRYKSPGQPGQFKIKAQGGSGALADSAVVTVSAVAVASVDVSPATAGLTTGQTTQLTATPRDASGGSLSGRVVTWTSSNGAVASVNGNGLVTAASAGSATITATSEGRNGSAALTVTSPTGGAWPNEPAGMTLLTDEPFGAMTENGWNQVQRQTTNGSGLAVSNDASAPVSPASVLTFKYAAGYQAGSEPGAEYFIPPTPVKETYMGFWWKASNPWQFHPSGVNKITFLFTAVDNIYLMMYDDGAGPTIQVEPQLLNDVRRLAPNVTATRVTLGTWHQIEWYVKQSTTGTSRDGVVRWWVDGVLQGEYTDLQMSVNPGFIEYTIAPTWGGIGGTKSETDYYWYDHYHVSRR